MRLSPGLAVAAAAVAAFTLTACGPASSPSPGATGPASAAPTPSAAAPAETSTPDPEPTAAAREVPPECESIDVELGGTLYGGDLGSCLQAAIAGYDTGMLTLTGPELAGEATYHYDPQFEFRANLETGDGPVEMSFVDGVMMLDDGSGPVVGDPESDDPDTRLAGVAGELYRVFSDPGFIGDLIDASESWNVADATDEVQLRSGETVTAYRVESSAPFRWFDIPVDSYAVQFTADWQPVSAASTSDFFGTSSTITQEFSRLGEPVSIEPLG
ncbi:MULTISPECIES: hypothetical protein [unclassified Microbacterium]|uniref:hypothetical protein n=1 Tax=unclassified Microbacterium TaxID=2609290 RepID=UPI003868FF43